jgi:phosphate/sulfate permease
MSDEQHWAMRYPDTVLSLTGFLMGFALGAANAGPAVGLVVAIIFATLSIVLAHGVDIGPAEGPHQ